MSTPTTPLAWGAGCPCTCDDTDYSIRCGMCVPMHMGRHRLHHLTRNGMPRHLRRHKLLHPMRNDMPMHMRRHRHCASVCWIHHDSAGSSSSWHAYRPVRVPLAPSLPSHRPPRPALVLPPPARLLLVQLTVGCQPRPAVVLSRSVRPPHTKLPAGWPLSSLSCL